MSDQRGWDGFAALYDEHHARLYRVALLLTNGRVAVAEDLVADAFVSVYRVWVDQPIANFFAYARKVVVNAVIAQARGDDVASRFLAVHRGEDRGVRGIDEAVVDARQVFAALERLPARQRAAVVLRYYEDLTYEQIAAVMGVRVGTAKAQVSVGLRRMRTLMGNVMRDDTA